MLLFSVYIGIEEELHYLNFYVNILAFQSPSSGSIQILGGNRPLFILKKLLYFGCMLYIYTHTCFLID